jgi:hypothetical protein
MSDNFNSRFKAYLVDHALLGVEAQTLAPYFLKLPKDLSEWRVCHVAYFFLVYFNHRAPKRNWFQVKCSDLLPVGEILRHGIFDQALVWMCHVQIRKIPQCFHLGLKQWSDEGWPMIITDQCLTPWDILDMQSQGKRVIGIHLALAQGGKRVDGRRDAFEFALHDLAHAFHFFNDNSQYQEQVLFFQYLNDVLKRPDWQDKMKENKQFLTKMHYIMADMNSHPAHLHQTLAAVMAEV